MKRRQFFFSSADCVKAPSAPAGTGRSHGMVTAPMLPVVFLQAPRRVRTDSKR